VIVTKQLITSGLSIAIKVDDLEWPWTSVRMGSSIRNLFVNVRPLNGQPKCVSTIFGLWRVYYVTNWPAASLTLLSVCPLSRTVFKWWRRSWTTGNYCWGSTDLMFACDELTTCLWWVDHVTSWPCDELTGSRSLSDRLSVFFVHVMSGPVYVTILHKTTSCIVLSV